MAELDVTIVTATYNKPEFLREAADSVFAQTDPGWLWWIILDGADEPTRRLTTLLAEMDRRIRVVDERTAESLRRAEYRPAVIINKFYPLVTTPYLCWLSDDDLWEPCFLSALCGKLRRHPKEDVAYGVCENIRQTGDAWRHKSWHPAERPLQPFGDAFGRMPDCRIDGGQIVHTRRVYAALDGWQLPTDFRNAGHVDGLFMNQLARRAVFRPVDRKVLTHRCTYLSRWQKGRR